jgi:hypothetical protein
MRENKKPSEIWIVNLEQQMLDKNTVHNYSSQLSGTYTPGQKEPVLFPIGYVLKHDGGANSYEVWDKGFEKQKEVIARPIYDGTDVSHLEGELLTVIDASFADKSQREAIKSLVRNTIWRFNARKEREVEEVFKASR